MSKQQEYLLNAEQCCEMAGVSENDEHRRALSTMAGTWRELAAEEERIADLVRAVDQLAFPNTDRLKAEEIQAPVSLIQRLEETLLGKKLLQKFDNDSPVQFGPTGGEAMNSPRWLSKGVFTMHEIRD